MSSRTDELLTIALAHIVELERASASLRNALTNIPYSEYSEALREGCEHSDAWSCFVGACDEYTMKALGGEPTEQESAINEALIVATAMLDPENQPPQFTVEQALEIIRKARGYYEL